MCWSTLRMTARGYSTFIRHYGRTGAPLCWCRTGRRFSALWTWRSAITGATRTRNSSRRWRALVSVWKRSWNSTGFRGRVEFQDLFHTETNALHLLLEFLVRVAPVMAERHVQSAENLLPVRHQHNGAPVLP